VMRPHVVQETIPMGDEGSGHVFLSRWRCPVNGFTRSLSEEAGVTTSRAPSRRAR
jgi:hypothetical protein